MATVTVTQMVTHTVNATSSATPTVRAPPQGGILEGGNPSVYDPKNPIILFVIQASIILIFCRILHFPLSRLRQPRVIAEVIAGILLGPSVMGHIPGFNNAIFPLDSMPALTLAANLGLVFFLFLVGLEVDLRFLASNWRIALSVGAAGMALPFGLGCAIAWGLYHQFRDDAGIKPISFGVYMLFIGVAMAITAFPVLCRILTELKLLHTPVGVVVLSAGVGNDVVGWILLALCVALVNAGAGITALYILLVAVGYALLLVFAIRPGFLWILRRTGSLHNGPTQSVVALTVLMVLASAFFTGVIGIHPIFGAFMIGLICPHEGGFAIKLAEKLEDLIGVLFLPLYFALSGLSTNLGLLNNGITWAYVIGVTSIAFTGKIAGGTLAAWLNGLVFRESLTIGVLMSCKGLIELIVLNIGLQAKILSTRTFTIFVVMALITTFATTPLTTLLYPKWYQEKLELWKKGKIDWDGNPILPDDTSSDRAKDSSELNRPSATQNILVYLRLDGLPSIFSLVSLMSNPSAVFPKKRQHHKAQEQTTPGAAVSDTSLQVFRKPLQVHGLRLIELTERNSSVMQVSEIEDYAGRDPIVKAFYTFAASKEVAATGGIAVIPERAYASTLLSQAKECSSDLVIIPWSETGSMSEHSFLGLSQWSDPLINQSFTSFVEETLADSVSTSIGVFIDRAVLPGSRALRSGAHDGPLRTLTRTTTGISLNNNRENQPPMVTSSNNGYHILVPFFGGEDDCFAVRLALQLAWNETVTATILFMAPPGTSSTLALNRLDDATDNAAFFFNALQTNLPKTLVSRVVFEECSPHEAGGLQAVVLDLERAYSAADSPEHITLHGLSGIPKSFDAPLRSRKSSSAQHPAGILNPWLLNVIEETQFEASLLVVQAKRDVSSGDELVKQQPTYIAASNTSTKDKGRIS